MKMLWKYVGLTEKKIVRWIIKTPEFFSLEGKLETQNTTADDNPGQDILYQTIHKSVSHWNHLGCVRIHYVLFEHRTYHLFTGL